MSNYLIVGGAGFIGVNAAHHYARAGHTVTILDNLSRHGTEDNLKWLWGEHPGVRFVRADIRTDQRILDTAAARCDVLLHLAAQVAVTTSVVDPRTDFEINALGTLSVLEAARRAPRPPIVLYSSTNKVYGGMEDVPVIRDGNRYAYERLQDQDGVAEEQPLDFHSPYGCSKGAADQYVRDYSRIYGLRTVVLRQSCIYGPHQFGNEDQGWVAWFMWCTLLGNPVTIFGDGQQVRDVLHVSDLIAAYDAAIENIDHSSGRVYNIGGGPSNTLSLLETLVLLEKVSGSKLAHSFSDWRPGDQRIYVSGVSRARRELGWTPKIPPECGIEGLHAWMAANLEVVAQPFHVSAELVPNPHGE
jgi:CDP-paratose 2-epimerase